MNKQSIILLIAVIFLSCNNNNHKADAYGNFEAVETIISAEANGKLMKFDLQEGMKLKKGQEIGFIDTSDLHLKKLQLIAQKKAVSSRLAIIDAQLAVQQEQLLTMEKENDRIAKLFEGGAATEKQMDDMAAQARVLKAQINATKTQKTSVYSELNVLERQIEQVYLMIEKCYLLAPEDGIVLNTYIEPMELAMQGKALYKIADVSTIILRAYISGMQLQQVKLGQQVKVLIDKDEDENIEFDGTIQWISETAEFTPKIIQTKEERVDLVYAMKVSVKNNGQIKIGMPGEVVWSME